MIMTSVVKYYSTRISLLILATQVVISTCADNSVFDLNTTEYNSIENLVRRHGYKLEHHTVKTEDGYILTVHRLREKTAANKNASKPVAFLQHGILCSSVDYVTTERSLGYQLMRQGYDVWLGNARGNTYSRRHETLDPDLDQEQFWDFSWHEIGTLDLPAMIDYILRYTNQRKLQYIGHSQGTAAFFVMASIRPEYNDKIKLMVALSPIAYFQHVQNPVIAEAGLAYRLNAFAFLQCTGQFGLYFHTWASETEAYLICQREAITSELCAYELFIITGWDSYQLNRTELPLIYSNIPAGSSSKQLIHFLQIIVASEDSEEEVFRNYDYGWLENLWRYGTLKPPSYPLEKITAPVALYIAQNDRMSNYTDARNFGHQISNLVHIHMVPYSKFNHMDFLYAKDVYNLLYKDVISFMKEYR